MPASEILRAARERAGLTQRALAERAGVPQSTIARIETGATEPRVSTLSRLLDAAGQELVTEQRLGIGVDRTLIWQLLRMTPEERIRSMASASEGLSELRKAMRRL